MKVVDVLRGNDAPSCTNIFAVREKLDGNTLQTRRKARTDVWTAFARCTLPLEQSLSLSETFDIQDLRRLFSRPKKIPDGSSRCAMYHDCYSKCIGCCVARKWTVGNTVCLTLSPRSFSNRRCLTASTAARFPLFAASFRMLQEGFSVFGTMSSRTCGIYSTLNHRELCCAIRPVVLISH